MTDKSISDTLTVKVNPNYNSVFDFEITPFKLRYENIIDNKDGPIARSGHRIVCDDYNVYVIGGYNPTIATGNTNPVLTDLWQYCFFTGKWRKRICENFPKEAASSAVLSDGGLLLVYGGTGYPFGARSSNRLLVCNLKSSDGICRFEEIKTTGDIPPALYGQCIVQNGKYFYTIGGTNGFAYYFDVHRLNLQTNVWKHVYSPELFDKVQPWLRYRHEITVYRDNVYVFGGGDDRHLHGFRQLPVYSLVENSWTYVKTLPDTRTGRFPVAGKAFSLVKNPKNSALAYISGGYRKSFPSSADCWQINLETMRWRRMDKLTLCHRLYFHASATNSSGMLVHFGGVLFKHSGRTDVRTNAMYTGWITVPRLRDICLACLSQLYKTKRCKEQDLRGLFHEKDPIIW